MSLFGVRWGRAATHVEIVIRLDIQYTGRSR